MSEKHDNSRPELPRVISRRGFFQVGGALVAGGTLALSSGRATETVPEAEQPPVKVGQYRTLGRTGFQVTDISLGSVRLTDAGVPRYAYDCGINYFDTAENYGDGASETAIGEAMQFMDRQKIFLTTKLRLSDEDTEETIRDRALKCLERLQTDYIDCLCIHSVKDLALINHTGFHAATDQLKAEGKLRFIGITSHGPDSDEQDDMEQVLTAAAEDGRFDLMLLVYGFLNKEEGERILAACKKHNVGTTAMKYAPGRMELPPPLDIENPSEQYAAAIERMTGRGLSRQEAIDRILNWYAEQEESIANMQPFLKKHDIKTPDELRMKSIQWVLQNPNMHTVCVSMYSFEDLNKFVPLSGTKLSRAENGLYDEWKYAFDHHYCRHSCISCAKHCPHGVPVSKIMRYAYYFTGQGREKYAMQKYARLRQRNAAPCLTCDAPCQGSCPHGVSIQASLFHAHTLLTVT
jgi:predicted aldo/keto reductase-like oxidoreductase